jgi:transcriptional regulator GlxA family with amidase domain
MIHFLPMARALIVVLEGAQTLDVTGPAEVFAMARAADGAKAYDVRFVAASPGETTTTSGAVLRTTALPRVRSYDTVIVSGGPEAAVVAALADERLGAWLRRARAAEARVASVCSGAFVLANSGLLDGLRAATHWQATDRLAAFRPAVTVDRDAIFVREGRIWTSAGITTGIDMALAMVEADHGRAETDRIAAQLVLYVRRPGFQSQWSDALVAQLDEPDPLAAVARRARTQLARLDVPRLARLAGMSVRTLHRRCSERFRTTPARFLLRLRVEHARTLLTTSTRPVKRVAVESGFGSAERMRRAFVKELGLGPRDVRLLFERG